MYATSPEEVHIMNYIALRAHRSRKLGWDARVRSGDLQLVDTAGFELATLVCGAKIKPIGIGYFSA